MSELYHHGVLGMRWGVRRYQNPDGSLTPAGKKRFSDVSDDPRKQEKDTKSYMRMKRKGIKINSKYQKAFERKAEKARRKELHYKAAEYDKFAKKYENNKKILEKDLDNVSKGKIKAGKNFIIQRDLEIDSLRITDNAGMDAAVNLGLAFFGIHSVGYHSTIIEKNK